MDTPAEPAERTIICSVVFLDVIGYSKEVVSQQMVWKRALNTLISNAIVSIPQPERVILDTGDGAALCFLRDPEMALVVALQLLDGFRGTGATLSPALLVRIGINMGSVKLVRDLNDQPNIVGEGINVAQRIMSFANANQILASRSFFEVVGCLTQQYRRLFLFHGLHKDKHQREHEVYEIKPELLLQPETDSESQRMELGLVPISPEGKVCEVILAPEVLGGLEALLRTYVGPMASMLVGKAVKSVPNLFELCSTLAEQIPRAEERDAFLRKASGLLSSSTPPVAPATAAPKPSPTNSGLDPALIDVIETELIHFVGPIAKVLVRKEAKIATSAEDLLLKLAQSIPTEKQRKDFEKKTLARIAKLQQKK